MKELQKQQQLSILRVLQEIMKADKRIHEKETAYFREVSVSFGLTEADIECIGQQDMLQVLSTLRDLDNAQKEEVAQLMGKMIVIDEDINYEEVKLYNSICRFCEISRDFDKDEYPGYTLSGPFPELDDNAPTLSDAPHADE
jgi:uncharacterized tellurite resistance protein B-like protein